ncbi:MAG: transposase family protein [Pseudoalteromonas sp.]|nr:transposase family protein [Pseudoalteromonas sp.]
MKLDNLIKKLNINTKYTKGLKKPKLFTKIKDRTYPEEDYNFMADLLQLPITKKNNAYLLVVVDLWSDEFDFEPIKNTQSKEVLKAFKKMIKRKHLNLPYASVQTDGGPEFKGSFNEFLESKNILHRTTKKGRKTQNANVESLNRVLGRLINGYMNTIELKTKKKFVEWDNNKVLNIIREELNILRKKPDGKKELKDYDYKATPKYKVGDLVNYALDVPKNALDEDLKGNFREGDIRFSIKPKEIKKVLRYPGDIPYRYILKYIPNASYTEQQLKIIN